MMRIVASLMIALVPVTVLAGAGAKLYNEFVDTDSIYADDELQKYVSDLGHYLLRHAQTEKTMFYFFVLDSSQINAFATPDGYIFINTGLLVFLESEDQLAAVIAHEIGHVVANHGARQRITRLLGQSAGYAAALLTGRAEMMNVSNAATRTIIAGYGREMELEADRIGAEIIARAGYNPMAVIDSLHVLKDQALFAKNVHGQPSSYHGLFASHPQSDKRLHDVVNLSVELMPDELRLPDDEYWTRINDMKYGTEQSTGLIKPNVFFSKDTRLVVEFPEKWRLRLTSNNIMGEAPSGAEEAWINVTRHTPENILEPSSFARDVLNRTDIVGEGEIEVRGNPVYIAELSTAGANKSLALLGLVYRGNDIYSIRGEAGIDTPPEEFRQDFESTVRGIRGLRPDDVPEDTRSRVVVVEAKPGITYEKLAQSSPIRIQPAETLRLINGDYPNGQPRAGDLIKVIQ